MEAGPLSPDYKDIGHLESLVKFWWREYSLRIALGCDDSAVYHAEQNARKLTAQLAWAKGELVPKATVLPASADGPGPQWLETGYPDTLPVPDSAYTAAIQELNERITIHVLGGPAVIEPAEDPEEKARKDKFWADAKIYGEVTGRPIVNAETWSYGTWYREYTETGMSWPLENMILAVKPYTVTRILDGRHYDEPVPKGYKKKVWHDIDGRPHEYVGANLLMSFKAHPVVKVTIHTLMILVVVLVTLVTL